MFTQHFCKQLFRRWNTSLSPTCLQAGDLLTNHLTFGASTISQIYRDRWEIELFFKLLKQHLKVKTFVGTSENALKIQLWTALIAVMIIKYLAWRAKRHWSFSNLIALLRWNLFTYRQLWVWLDDPFEAAREPPPTQLTLPFLDSTKDGITTSLI